MNLNRFFWTRYLTATCIFLFVPLAQAMIWAESYDSMIERAELIFIGTLSETKTYRLKETIYPYRTEPEKAQEVEGLYTDHVFIIDRVLKGNYSERLGRIKALFHETDKYRSSLLRQLSPRAPTFGHTFQLDFREILQKRVTGDR